MEWDWDGLCVCYPFWAYCLLLLIPTARNKQQQKTVNVGHSRAYKGIHIY